MTEKTTEYTSVSELQSQILLRISSYQANDPFAPVVILTNSPLEGFLLRRQLAEKRAESGAKALANIQVSTPAELISSLCVRAGIYDISRTPTTVIEAAIFALMESSDKDNKSVQSMATSNAIAKVHKKLELVSTEDVQTMMSAESATSTQRKVLEMVLTARKIQSGTLPSNAVVKLFDLLSSGNQEITQGLGQVHSLALGLPKAVLKVLAELQNATEQVFIYAPSELPSGKLEAGPGLHLISSPDPVTEASIAVRAAIHKLSESHADRVAIIYADESQYLNQIQDELNSSGVTWHGKGRTMSQSSVLYRTLEILLESLVERREDFSGFDRPKLMRLLQNGFLKVDEIDIAEDTVRKFVRRQELYADAVNWLDILNFLEQEAENDRDSLAREHLGLLLKTIETGLNHISKATTWEQLGQRLKTATSELHLNLEIEEGSVEERVWGDLTKLLESELLAIDELGVAQPELKLKVEAGNLLRLVRKRVGESRVRVGNLSTGIFVGTVSDAQLLTFETVFLLGATEGLLPPTVNSDPFLPSQLLTLVEENSLEEWSRENLPGNLGRTLNAFLSGSNKVVILRPRGGTVGKLEDEPSRYLPSSLNEKEESQSPAITMVASLRSSFAVTLDGHKIGPVSQSDQLLQAAELEPKEDEVFKKSMQAWRDPEFDEYFGNLSKLASVDAIWKINHKTPLSSTRIDAYLQCPYKFFADTVLGFKDSDRSDVLDEFSASAFGTYFHQAMDKYIKDLAKEGRLPGPSQPFPTDAVQTFINRYLQPNLNRFVATGKNGWNRSLQIHVSKLVKTLPIFFGLEAQALRSNPDLAIMGAEESFGKGVLLPESEITNDKNTWDLEVEDNEGEKHRLVGQIDRLDVSADRKSVGIMDFKTGKRKNLIEKLGMHTKAQSSVIKSLQDVVYKKAAQSRFGQDIQVKVHFVFPTQPADKMFLEAKYADDPKGLLPRTLSEIKESGKSGHYLSVKDSYCKACKYLDDLPDIVIRKEKAKEAK